jgi:murein DD-endopeptidase MepM/ murein hydrolase activator NlpD
LPPDPADGGAAAGSSILFTPALIAAENSGGRENRRLEKSMAQRYRYFGALSRRRRTWCRAAGLVVLLLLAGWVVLSVHAAFFTVPPATDTRAVVGGSGPGEVLREAENTSVPPGAATAASGDAAAGSEGVLPPSECVPAAIPTAADPPPASIVSCPIRRGDTASTLLAEYLDPAGIYALAQACEPLFSLDRLRPGRPLTLRLRGGKLIGLNYEIDDRRCLRVEFVAGEPQVALQPIPHDMVTAVVEGCIETSLYAAVAAAGERPELAVRLADIFAWEIDFVHDLRPGDRFSALVQKRYRDGRFRGYEAVEAAAITARGSTHIAVRHLDPDGTAAYFTPAGNNLRRAFLKAPLDFTRISSGYTPRRLHPIRKIWLPHYGIDYAAPVGTPVKAIGDGTVVRVTRDRHAGKFIVIRHPNGYQSYYLHLSRWARGLRPGIGVSQGQVIGYVGSTGMSTGPHLDFRLKKDGMYVNPLRVESPRARRLTAAWMPDFTRKVHVCLALLPPWAGTDSAPLFAARTKP